MKENIKDIMPSGFSGRADACRRMTEEELSPLGVFSLSSLGKSRRDATRGSIKTMNSSLLDSPIKSGNDREKGLSSSGIPSLSFPRRRESIAVGESGRSISSLSPLGPTGGAIAAETGRSMTEMLGVLAIIGVLSVGAIGGYSYGMDKYRANQTVNDIMLRAVDAVKQKNNLNDEWPTISTVGYPITFVEDDGGNYGIQVDNVPTRVCKMVGDTIDTLAEVLIVAPQEHSGDPCDAAEENTMIFFFDNLSCFPKCAEDEFCRWGECVTKTIEKYPKIGGTCTNDSECQVDYTGTNCGRCLNGYCVANGNSAGNSCTLSDGTAGQCVRGKCIPKGCNDENPCTGQYEYCASTNASCTEDIPSGQTGACVKPDFKPIIVDDTQYWVSNTAITYWDAYIGCQVMGKEMVDVEDMAVNWKGGKE